MCGKCICINNIQAFTLKPFPFDAIAVYFPRRITNSLTMFEKKSLMLELRCVFFLVRLVHVKSKDTWWWLTQNIGMMLIQAGLLMGFLLFWNIHFYLSINGIYLCIEIIIWYIHTPTTFYVLILCGVNLLFWIPRYGEKEPNKSKTKFVKNNNMIFIKALWTWIDGLSLWYTLDKDVWS